MLHSSTTVLASLRYRRPYWMLFLKGVDNWKIYTVIQQPDHQRTEMLYQAWLGGLDRPYVRPKCMAHQPVWLTKKRHLLQKAKLQGAETHLEKYVLEWYQRFHCFQGNQRPSPEDLHIAFDLVETPLDLSYAFQLLHQCRNHFNIRLAEESFLIFLEACLRVKRMDCVVFAYENRAALGFWNVDDDCRKFVLGEQSWYKRSQDHQISHATEENVKPKKAPDAEKSDSSIEMPTDELDFDPPLERTQEASGSSAKENMEASKDTVTTGAMEIEDEELARLEAELAALELEDGKDGSGSNEDE